MPGFWEPHSSSIDFCESNYLITEYITEFHNTWSSLIGISSFGLIGLFKGNATKELRYTLAYGILAFIGLGSAGLHGTLHWIFQASDELPMIYGTTTMIYIFLEYDSKEPKYPRLPTILTVLMVVTTIAYYTFQETYIVFLSMYSILEWYSIYLLYKVVWIEKGGGVEGKKIAKMSCFTYVFVAVPVWIIDMGVCDFFLKHFPFGMTLHILWHFAAAHGAYCSIVCGEHCRLVALGIPCECQFLFGVIPISTKVHNKKID